MSGRRHKSKQATARLKLGHWGPKQASTAYSRGSVSSRSRKRDFPDSSDTSIRHSGVSFSWAATSRAISPKIIVASLWAARASGKSMLWLLEWSPWRMWKPKLGMLRSYWAPQQFNPENGRLSARLPTTPTRTGVFHWRKARISKRSYVVKATAPRNKPRNESFHAVSLALDIGHPRLSVTSLYRAAMFLSPMSSVDGSRVAGAKLTQWHWSGAVFCPACWRSRLRLLALMESANKVPFC